MVLPHMSPRKDSLVVELVKCPWWVSVVLAGVSYIGLTVLFPLFEGDSAISKVLASAGPGLAPIVLIVFLIIGGISALRGFRVRKTFAKQNSLDSLTQLSWKEFEDIMGEYFRRRGYEVKEQLTSGADGGVDLRLRKNGEKTLVQCKRWKSKRVGLPIVREVLGSMTAENANNGILMTTSSYTREAQFFAQKHSIELMDGISLLPAIKKVQLIKAVTRNDLQST